MVAYCHVIIFAETMENDRKLEQEEMLGEIIHDGDDDITSLFLTDCGGEGMEGEDDSSGVGYLTVAKSGEVY